MMLEAEITSSKAEVSFYMDDDGFLYYTEKWEPDIVIAVHIIDKDHPVTVNLAMPEPSDLSLKIEL